MSLTFDDYKANIQKLEELFKAYVPKMWNRAHLKPEFDRVFVCPLDSPWINIGKTMGGDSDKDTIGVIGVNIIEMDRTLSYFYSIKKSGLILQRRAKLNIAGGLTCYMEIVRVWADSLRLQLSDAVQQEKEVP